MFYLLITKQCMHLLNLKQMVKISLEGKCISFFLDARCVTTFVSPQEHLYITFDTEEDACKEFYKIHIRAYELK